MKVAGAKRLIVKPHRITTIVMMLIVWAGVASALFAAISTDLRNREYLRGRVQTIARSLSAEQIKQLQGNSDDLDTEIYQDLKVSLQQIRGGNPDLQFVYLMQKHDDTVHFLVDSELPNTAGYSAPGDIYDEASQRLKNSFSASEPTIEGPSKDHWGVWMSAMAPIIDPKTQQTVAVVGIDTPALTYYTQIALYSLVPLLLAAIPFAGLVRDMKLQSKEQEIIRLKEQFVSIASHELRSPLAGMLWAIQTLNKAESGKLNKEQTELLTDMYRSTESSLATVNEILDMSIFERGKADRLQHDAIDLVPLLKQVAGTLQLSAQEKKLTITPNDNWPEHAFIIGDVAALKRAFMNIISNSIKYSREETDIALFFESNDHEYVIGIKDHGIGIPPEEQAKVLEGYYRATNATAVQSHGTGLGLWVTKQIIEHHGGRLWLTSATNEGTTIFAALPRQAEKKPTAELPKADPSENQVSDQTSKDTP